MVIIGDPVAASGARESRNDNEESQLGKSWVFSPTVFLTEFSPNHFEFPLPPVMALDLQGCFTDRGIH